MGPYTTVLLESNLPVAAREAESIGDTLWANLDELIGLGKLRLIDNPDLTELGIQVINGAGIPCEVQRHGDIAYAIKDGDEIVTDESRHDKAHAEAAAQLSTGENIGAMLGKLFGAAFPAPQEVEYETRSHPSQTYSGDAQGTLDGLGETLKMAVKAIKARDFDMAEAYGNVAMRYGHAFQILAAVHQANERNEALMDLVGSVRNAVEAVADTLTDEPPVNDKPTDPESRLKAAMGLITTEVPRPLFRVPDAEHVD